MIQKTVLTLEGTRLCEGLQPWPIPGRYPEQMQGNPHCFRGSFFSQLQQMP